MDEIILTDELFDKVELALRERVQCAESREDEDNAYSHLDLLWDAPMNTPVSDDLRETLELLDMID